MPYLTRKQAMERLHVCNKKMWQLTTARKIPFYQDTPGGKMLFLDSDLDRYMESIRVTSQQVSPYATLRKRRASSIRSTP